MGKLFIKFSFIGVCFLLTSAYENERIYFPDETRPTEGGIDPGLENPFLDGGVVETTKFEQHSMRIYFPDETRPTEGGIDPGIENPFLDGGVVETTKSGLDTKRIIFPDETKPTEGGIDPGIDNSFLDGGVVDTTNFEQDSMRIYFPDEARPTEGGIDSRIENPSLGGGGVKSPKFGDDWICGYEHVFSLRYSGIMKQREGVPLVYSIYFQENKFYSDSEGKYHILGENKTYPPVYYLNETAEKLAAEGFNIQVNEVGFNDVLCNFTYSNGTFEDTLGYEYIRYLIPVGGEPANVTRAYYMAQIGEQKEGKIKWLCDGVLINNRWILSAAHCFTMAGVNPNVVRLGDLDKDDFKDPPLDRTHEFIRDYQILEVVPYPDFNINERYHDMVLIQISRPIPLHSSTIFPICLPWETETNRDLVGMNVTLTGWGATKYNGPKTSRLQEVNLTVFDTTVCHNAYFDIPENRRSYPKGITNDKLLCVGWKEDGKDACGGDSGAPIVYLKDLDLTNPRRITVKAGKECGISNENPEFPIYVQKREYVLAGIVSRGFGCGIKEFPGLYMPINKPNYLQWIKDIAFKEYV